MMLLEKDESEAAMHYEILEFDSGVDIHIHQTGERTPRLLAALQDCQQGRCSCPTDQYDRLQNMTVRADVDQLTVQLQPRAGQRLDPDQLQVCLDYTLAQAETNAG